MPTTPPHHSPGRFGALSRFLGVWCAALVLFAAGLVPSLVGEVAAASSKSSKSKKKSSAKKKKSPAKKPATVRPVRRDASGPQSVPDGDMSEAETDGEGDLEGDDVEGGDPESELEAIERELLAQPLEPDPEVRYSEPPPPPPPSEPVWHKHTPIPGETLEDIARRYGVTPADIGKWNGIKADGPIPSKKKYLRIKSAVVPPPRERVEHLVKRGDTWDSVAKKLGVAVDRLRKFNPRLGDKLDPTKKHKVVAWVDLDVSPAVALTTKLGQIRVRGGGLSIGKPNRGRLVRGVELPERPDLYTRRKPDEAYGSTHTVVQMLAAFTRFRHESGYKGEVGIGGMSRARGGRFRPHKSHQSGRDVDIRLPLLASAQGKKHPTSADVDWKATWQLMRSFIETGEVEYIFLDYKLQKRIYKAAREAGVSKEQIDAWLQWPAKSRTNKGVIRHVEGHTSHMHVRIRCGANEKHCYSSR